MFIKVKQKPLFELGPDTVLCYQDEAQIRLDSGVNAGSRWFDTASIDEFSYQWMPAASMDTFTSIDSMILKDTGIYSLRIYDTLGCFKEDQMEVKQGLRVSLGADQQYCEQKPVSLSPSVRNEEQSPTFTWNAGLQASTYFISELDKDSSLRVIADDGRCRDFDTVFIDMLELPLVNLVADTGFCLGETFSLSASRANTPEQLDTTAPAYYSQLTANPSFIWFEEESGSVLSNTQQLNLTDSNTVVLQLIDDNGCVNSDSLTVDVTDIEVNYTDQSICEKDSLSLAADSIKGKQAQYEWINLNNNSTLNGQSVSIKVDSSTDYRLKASTRLLTTIECFDSVDFRINTKPNPVANFSADTLQGGIPLEVQFYDSSLYANQWLWYFGDEDSSTSNRQNPVFEYQAHGFYSVKLWVSDSTVTNCYDSFSRSDYIYLDSTTGLLPLIRDWKIELFPNPADERLNIKVEQRHLPLELLIINAGGEEVKRIRLKASTEELNISELPAGAYFLNFIDKDKGVMQRKLIVE